MQHQIQRFERRNASIIGISVDQANHSERLLKRLGLSFELGSDPQQKVVKAFGVQNPETNELALHAVYVVNKQGHVIYRKVASRRPTSVELIDAIDAYRGDYPRADRRQGRPARVVAYPSNNFQTLIELATVPELPASLNGDEVRAVVSLMKARQSDDALVAFRRLIANSSATQTQRLQLATWLVHSVFVANKPEAIAAGRELQRRLRRVAELENQTSADAAEADELIHTLAAARGGLVRARAKVQNNADLWNLRYAQGSLRSYREVALEEASK